MAEPVQQRKKIEDILSSNEHEAVKIDQIAKVRGWFRPEENSPFYPTVLKYLEGDIDIDTAASQLFEQIDQKIIARQLDDVNFVDFWYSIIHAAKRKSFNGVDNVGERKPSFHDRVTDLVTAFRDHKIKDHEEYNYIYSSLTDLSMACREVFNDTPRPYASDLEIDAWANVNLFFARLTEKGIQDLSLFAIWSMRDALEYEWEDDVEGTAAQKYNVNVPAATAWIFGMGRALYTKEEDLTPTNQDGGNPAAGGALWRGKAEFSKERWALWKERLAAVSKLEEVSEKTKNITKDALEAMERAETFSANEHSANAGS
ncbi:hypothetical protein C7974DRAFT_415920 [Boeremia exigua]|uniref:uncharacterized protein n=1 Tax=Boeremia exigua TaxID=749465 RepID=UPI001E8D2D71|nr:uncharacterized protein C7974DRAFT_415920 [Boeremia exigua]KAH6618553.1 hypothetical protein C7974DRAFT_415920 [Boeremia exigua]